jgi:uncharacterized LabA/DUF88 family protein
MFSSSEGKLTRIAVFIDGGYFHEVSNYYKYVHARSARISVRGLHDFIRHEVKVREKVDDESRCQIVESHYFRGRFSASEAAGRDKLEGKATFDDVLIREGIVQHYLPATRTPDGRAKESGIDVWLSLEAFDLAVHKRFDVLALVGSDGDYVPLMRKLNGIGTRTMVLAWDFSYEYQGKSRTTRTNQVLIECSTYPVLMATRIDSGGTKKEEERYVNGLFVERVERKGNDFERKLNELFPHDREGPPDLEFEVKK